MRKFAIATGMLLLAACGRPSRNTVEASSARAVSPAPKREIRLTGIVDAVRSSKITVPQAWGPGGPLTLTRLITNGTRVNGWRLRGQVTVRPGDVVRFGDVEYALTAD